MTFVKFIGTHRQRVLSVCVLYWMLLRRFKNMNYYPRPHRVTVVLQVQGVGERTLFWGNSSGWFSNGTFASVYDASKKSWVCGSCLNHSKISDWKLHYLDLDPTLKPGEIITVLHTLLKICWLVLVFNWLSGCKTPTCLLWCSRWMYNFRETTNAGLAFPSRRVI